MTMIRMAEFEGCCRLCTRARVLVISKDLWRCALSLVTVGALVSYSAAVQGVFVFASTCVVEGILGDTCSEYIGKPGTCTRLASASGSASAFKNYAVQRSCMQRNRNKQGLNFVLGVVG